MEVSGTPEQPSIKSRRCKLQLPRLSQIQSLTNSQKLTTLTLLRDFLRTWDSPRGLNSQDLRRFLCLRSYTDLDRSDSPEPIPVDCDLIPGELALDNHDEDAELQNKLSEEKQQSANRSRSELLGSDHKQARSEIRSKLQEGYYISHSGKKAIRVVHCLGRCYMLPGVDYLSFSYAGSQFFPASDEYDTVCKWCAKAQESKADPGSSGTNTSSSSDE